MFYPTRSPAPDWAVGVLSAFANVASEIDSKTHSGVTSNDCLAALRPELEALGFEIEGGKTMAQKISRPVLFGENGKPKVSYEVDGFHPGVRAILEVEAGRGAANNADYRDLVRAGLMVGVDFLILAMMKEYRTGRQVIRSYEQTRRRLDAIYASNRLSLPLLGVLLIGY
jgi:hypothetical protein